MSEIEIEKIKKEHAILIKVTNAMMKVLATNAYVRGYDMDWNHFATKEEWDFVGKSLIAEQKE